MTATANAKEDKIWRPCDKKKMEGDDSLRTLDCLRGRLLAERQASKVAKEEAQLMSNKLMEIENRLREETKLRQKAEKKLQLLMKKLQSLNISPAALDLDLHCSDKDSFTTSSSITSCSKEDIKENQDTEDSNSVSQIQSCSAKEEDESENDNSMALVAVSRSEEIKIKKKSELKIVNKSVGEVLDALRHAREKIQSSIQRRQMIRVGPS